MVKGQSGGDASIDFGRYSPDSVIQKIKDCSPVVLAFNGKKAAQVLLSESQVKLGLHTHRLGKTKLFVAPSTSGAANRDWNEDVWYDLAELVQPNAT